MPPSLPGKTPNYFPALTGLRAVAAYMVFVYHYPFGFWKERPLYLYNLIREFHVGVTVFFVLSGFLITYRYLGKSELTNRFLKQYMLNRVARIYPVYFLLTTAAFLIGNVWPWPNFLLREYLANITFLRGFSKTLRFTGIAPGWTLTVEECFYLFAPLLFYMLLRYRKHTAMVWVLSCLLLIGIGAGLTYLLHGRPSGAFADYSFTFSGTFFGRFSEFFIGAGLAIYLRNSVSLTSAPYATYLGLAGSLATIIGMALVQYTFHAGFSDKISTEHSLGFLLNGTVLPCFIACFFYGLINEKTWVSSALAHPISELLGKSSYAFYLIHLSFLPSLGLGLSAHGSASQYILFFVICQLLSIGIYYLIEEPANKWIRALGTSSAHVQSKVS